MLRWIKSRDDMIAKGKMAIPIRMRITISPIIAAIYSCAHVYSHVYMCTACLKPFFLSIETIDIVQLNTRIVYDDFKHYLLKKRRVDEVDMRE